MKIRLKNIALYFVAVATPNKKKEKNKLAGLPAK
jgi:hypothetical protein